MMCNSEFRDKSHEVILDYLYELAENAQHWNIVGFYKSSSKLQSSPFGGGMYNLREDHDFWAKFASLDRNVEALKWKKCDNVTSIQDISCHVCSSIDHFTQDCSTLPAIKESLHEQVNFIDNFKKPNFNPYSLIYNFRGRNHSNFSWKNNNYTQFSQPPLPCPNF